jgi:hypothetical protein
MDARHVALETGVSLDAIYVTVFPDQERGFLMYESSKGLPEAQNAPNSSYHRGNVSKIRTLSSRR